MGRFEGFFQLHGGLTFFGTLPLPVLAFNYHKFAVESRRHPKTTPKLPYYSLREIIYYSRHRKCAQSSRRSPEKYPGLPSLISETGRCNFSNNETCTRVYGKLNIYFSLFYLFKNQWGLFPSSDSWETFNSFPFATTQKTCKKLLSETFKQQNRK